MNLARAVILVTGMMALLLGGGAALTVYQQNRDQKWVDRHQQLKQQAQVFVDQFYALMNLVQSTSEVASIPSVTHRGVVLVQRGVPVEIETFDAIKSISADPDFALEERVLEALKKQIKFGDFVISKLAVGTYAKSAVGSQEAIFVAQPIFAPQSVGPENPKSIQGAPAQQAQGLLSQQVQKIKITLIDPQVAFSSLSKWGKTANTEEALAGYLLNRSGKVIAHSNANFVGTQLTKIESLRNIIDGIFLGAQTGTVSHYNAVDGNEKQVALVRAGVYPFAFAVETNAPPALFSKAWLEQQEQSGAARKALGIFLVLIAIAMMSMLALQTWFQNAIQNVFLGKNIGLRNNVGLNINTEHHPQAMFAREDLDPIGMTFKTELSAALPPTTLPPRVEEKVETFAQSQNKIEAERTVAQDSVVTMVTANQEYDEFMTRLEAAYATDTLESELCEFASRLTESPVLYFRYYPRSQTFSLASAAGDVKITQASAMQVYVRRDIEQQVLQLANQGKVASLSNYGPLARMMISNLNVAHFEAWVVASDTTVDAYGAKMVGVLIVLRAGFKSAQVRPLLAKAIRETGNFVHLQNNRMIASKDNSIASRTPGISPTL